MHCILGGGGGALDGEFLYTCLFQTRPHASTPLACLPACLPTHVNCTTIANKFIHNLAGYIQKKNKKKKIYIIARAPPPPASYLFTHISSIIPSGV